jgi:hypothetical protein
MKADKRIIDSRIRYPLICFAEGNPLMIFHEEVRG